MRDLRLLALLFTGAACTTHPKVTYLDVQVLFDSNVVVDQLVFSVESGTEMLLDPTARPESAGAPLPSGGHVAIILPDSAAGREVAVRVAGRHQGQDLTMLGMALATPVRGQMAPVNVILGQRSDLVSLAITPNQAVAVGAAQQLKATGTFFDGTSLDLTTSASWASSDPALLGFDEKTPGLASGVAAGEVMVSASVLGITGQLQVKVSTAQLKQLSITPVSPLVPVGLTRGFQVTGAFDDDSVRDLTDQVTWLTTDPNIATFDGHDAGLLHARQPGMVSITAKLGAVTGTTSAVVTDATLTSIVMSPTNPKLARGVLKQLFATGLLSDGNSLDLTDMAEWSSSDVTLAEVGNLPGSRGQVNALGEGTVTITASHMGVSGTTTVTISAATLKSLSITPGTSMLSKGTSAQLLVTGVFSDATVIDLTGTAMWSSEKPELVSVGNDAANKGRVTGNGEGSATVHTTAGGLTASATVVGTSAQLTSITITPINPLLAKGGRVQLTATGTFSDQSVQDLTEQVTWAAGDDGVVTISNIQGTRGLAFAVSPGSVLAAASYGGVTGSTTITATPATLQSLTITPSNVTIANGTGVQLHASGVFSDQSMQDLTTQVTWTSGAMGVAIVSNAPGSQGLATSVMPGDTSVTVTLGNVTTSTNLKITAAQLASIGVQPTHPNVPNGASQAFHAVGVYADQTTQELTDTVTWGSSDPQTATISNAAGSHGVAHAVAPSGSATISATLGGVTGSATLSATAAVLAALEVTPTNPTAPLGTTVQFQATGIYSDQTRRDLSTSVSWSSSNPSVAAISNVAGSQGLATTLGVGATAIVSASLTGVSGTTSLTVTDAVLIDLSVQPTNPTLALGTQQQFTAVGVYSDGTHKDLTDQVTWSSSLPQVATISNTDGSRGFCNSISVGATTIVSATLNGLNAETTLTVSAATLRSLEVSPVQSTIPLGTSVPLVATGTFTDNSTQNLTAQVTWSSSNGNVAAVSNQGGSEGQVDSLGVGGPIIITAQLGGLSAIAHVTVTAAGLRSISVTPPTTSLALGTTQQLTATGIYTDNTTQDLTAQVTWSTSGLGIAQVSNGGDSEGLVTSVGVGGPVTITAFLSGRSGTAEVTVTDATLKSIVVTPAQSAISLGTTQLMQATGIYTDGTSQDLTAQATWSSSNEGVATISSALGSEALVTSVAAGGPISLSATFGGKTGAASLTVSPAVLDHISITPTNPDIPMGTTQLLTAIGTYSDGTTQDLTEQATWSSSGPLVASVSNAAGERGLVTPLFPDFSVTISATVGNISASTLATVTTAELVSLTISPTSPSTALGIDLQLTVTGTYTDQTTVDLTTQATWSSSNENVATVSTAGETAGLVTPVVANASAVIHANFGGKVAATTVGISPALLQSLTISPGNPSVPKGLTVQLHAIGHFSDGTAPDLSTQVTWDSADSGVATVSSAAGSEGLASGLVEGASTITARLGNVTGSTLLTVSMAQLNSITLTPGSLVLASGTQARLVATGNFSDGNHPDLTSQASWDCPDPLVATLSNLPGSEGVAIAVGPGSTLVTATVNGVTGSAQLQVNDVALVSIAVTPNNPNLTVSQSLQLTAIGTFEDLSTQDLSSYATWSSTDDTVVQVSNADGMRGLCSAVAQGAGVAVNAALLGQIGSTFIDVNP